MARKIEIKEGLQEALQDAVKDGLRCPEVWEFLSDMTQEILEDCECCLNFWGSDSEPYLDISDNSNLLTTWDLNKITIYIEETELESALLQIEAFIAYLQSEVDKHRKKADAP